MADIKYKEGAARTVVINDDAALANNTRAAADYNNDTLLDLFGDVFLVQQFDTTAPSAGDKTGELHILPGDNAATEKFPEGGDAGLGTDDDPQKIFLVGVFETINPSISVDETLGLPGIRLFMAGNRFVFKNVSGQQMDLTWQLDIHPYKLQSA